MTTTPAIPAALDTLHAAIEAALAQAYERLGETYMRDSPAEELWHDLVLFGAGGKRLRPLLLALAYTGYAGAIPPAVWRVAAGIEVLHTFALIHDDIVDRSPERRRRPTLPARLRQAFRAPAGGGDSGADLALLAGDVLYSYAMELLLSVDLPPDRLVRALKVIASTAVVTGLGAFAEVVERNREGRLSREQRLALCDHKTGAYSFCCPLQVAGVLAGVAEDELQRLDAYGRHLGRAFQIRDDLDEVRERLLDSAQDGTGVPQETLLLFPIQLALPSLGDADAARLRALCLAGRATPAERETLRELLDRTGALTASEAEIRYHLRLAEAAGERLTMAPRIRSRLSSYCAALALPPAPPAEA